MDFSEIRRDAVYSGAIRCSIGSALATSALHTLGSEIFRNSASDGSEHKKSWVKIVLASGEGVVGGALILNGASRLRSF